MSHATGGDDRVTVEECLEFVYANSHVFLLGRRRDGLPTGWAMTGRPAERSIEFSTYRASVKVRDLLRERVATVVVPADDPHDDRVLIVSGSVEEADGHGEWAGATSRRAGGSAYQSVPAEITSKVRDRHGSGKRTVLRVSIESARFTRKLPPIR